MPGRGLAASIWRRPRALALPAEIDENKVDASFAKGVLKITIAKKPEGKSATRKIEISAD